MLQNNRPRRNIRSFRRWRCFERPEARGGGLGREFGYRRDCRAAFRQTYWTSALCKSMSYGHAGAETGRRAGGAGPSALTSLPTCKPANFSETPATDLSDERTSEDHLFLQPD